MAIQNALLTVTSIVITPIVVIKAGGMGGEYASWAAFAALFISGLSTILQSAKLGRIGSGHMLFMGTSGAFMAICTLALREGGPSLMANLVIAAALFQFIFAAKLSFFRRIITPMVAGVVIMLIAVTVMPILFNMLGETSGDSNPTGKPICAATTILATAIVILKGKGVFRLWAPIIGVIAGTIMCIYFDMYDFSEVKNAPLIGLPSGGWVGLDFQLGSSFWLLLPAFIFVTLVGAIETIGDAIAIQQISWKKKKAIDFKAIQGAVNADGVGNLLSGLMSTVPNTTYSSSISITEITGVASRKVGIYTGIIFATLAFSPKLLALIMSIPDVVAGSYVMILISIIFILGVKIVAQHATSYRMATIAGISFWIGVGFQGRNIFPSYFSNFKLLENGMTTGGITAILLTIILEFTKSKSERIKLKLNHQNISLLHDFLLAFGKKKGWNEKSLQRLCAVGEETCLNLLERSEHSKDTAEKNLLIVARGTGKTIELEFMATTGDENIEDQLSLLGNNINDSSTDRDVSLRLLKHMSASIKHQQYNDMDIITVSVDS